MPQQITNLEAIKECFGALKASELSELKKQCALPGAQSWQDFAAECARYLGKEIVGVGPAVKAAKE